MALFRHIVNKTHCIISTICYDIAYRIENGDTIMIDKKITHESVKLFFRKPVVNAISLSFLLNIFVEMCSKESVIQGLIFPFRSPYVFLCNGLIIAITMIPALFFARRYFYYMVASFLWCVVGVADFVLLQFRTTPFTFVDVTMIGLAAEIWNHYMSAFQMALILFGLLICIAGCAVYFRKCKKVTKPPFSRMLGAEILMIATTIVTAFFGIRLGVLSDSFGNIADAYQAYGVPYCFVSGIIDTGIQKPKGYSDEYVQQIIEAIENGTLIQVTNENTREPSILPGVKEPEEPAPSIPDTDNNSSDETDMPNILFLQLESFFDPTAIIGCTFTEDPIPNWHSLLSQYSSGYLSVPSIGAGTANTEFEVITGMNLDYFGPGEYPYKTVLQNTTSETIGYVLKPLGYTAHAIHNNNGSFYERQKVFCNLGFDTFTSVEYMQNVERTPLDWAKDEILVTSIADCLNSTEGRDFIYTISVQGHGSYPAEPLLENPVIGCTLPEGFTQEQNYQLLYYVNQIHEMDAFIADLISYLESIEEDTVLVMYGDHLPGLKLTQEQLANGNLYQTQYVLWSNFEMERLTGDLESFQLYSYVLERLGIEAGILNRFHQTQKASESYLQLLEILEYDMLYGERTAWNGEAPYEPTGLQMGIHPIRISEIRAYSDLGLSLSDSEPEKGLTMVFLIGQNFTPYSVVQVNGNSYSTMFISENVISAKMPIPALNDLIAVTQQGNDGLVLSSSNVIQMTEETLSDIYPAENPTLKGED